MNASFPWRTWILHNVSKPTGGGPVANGGRWCALRWSLPAASSINSATGICSAIPPSFAEFSEATTANGLLFVSGQIGNLPGTLTLAPGGINGESKQALANLQAVLERHGCGLRDVVKCTVFLADIAEWPAFNDAYRQVFAAPFPARSALAASGLALGSRVEVECIAVVPGAR